MMILSKTAVDLAIHAAREYGLNRYMAAAYTNTPLNDLSVNSLLSSQSL